LASCSPMRPQSPTSAKVRPTTVNGLPLEDVVERIAAQVRAKGDTPAVRIHPHQEFLEHRLEYGWAAWAELSEAEQSQIIATKRIRADVDFVNSYWPLYGKSVSPTPVEEDYDEDDEELE